jgi:opacity protein-like surface antigen
MRTLRVLVACCLVAAALLVAPNASAQSVQIAPLAGYGFGGRFFSDALDLEFKLKDSFDYGGALDLAVGKTWRLEFLYSRRDSELQAQGLPGFNLDLQVERFFVGLQEEVSPENRTRPFGTLLLGVTRFKPGFEGVAADDRFTVGVNLGFKSWLNKNFGIRVEGRAYYVLVESGGGILCSEGTCFIRISGSGLWQTNLSGGLVLAF